MPAGNPGGYAQAGWGWAVGTGGASAIMDATTDINPLLEVTPSPWTAPIYGLGTLNPMEAARRLKMVATGGKFEYGGAWGYKTLFTGVKPGSLASNLSLGNVVLSATEMTGQAIGHVFGIQDDPFIKSMSNAREGGLAKMFGNVETVESKKPLTKKRRQKIYDNLKKKHKSAKPGGRFLRRKYRKALEVASTVTTQKPSGITKFLFAMGGESATGGKLMLNTGAKGMAGIGARAAAGLSGIGTAMFLYDILSMPISGAIDAAESGVTDLATGLMQWQKESVLTEFGHGRIHQAMSSSGAATERRRAIQASYSARINPNNRMFGNEARYHHR